MKKIIIIFAMLSFVFAGLFQNLFARVSTSNEIKKIDALVDRQVEPSLTLPEALEIAQKYVKEKNIDVSERYLDNIQLMYDSSWTDGKYWRIVWKYKKLTLGGEIFIYVGMDKSIKIFYGTYNQALQRTPKDGVAELGRYAFIEL